jgi:deoxycytidylate deaminase
MPIVENDPTFISNKEKHFISIASAIAQASTHPMCPGGCIIVRDREIVGDGRSMLAACKVEIDCITHAIAAAAKKGTPTNGAVVYSTRYPFSAAVFQLYLMGIKKLVVLAHEWEPYYKDEFRRAAKLARELGISIEPYFDDEQNFTTNHHAPTFAAREEQFNNKDLYTSNPVEEDDYEIETTELGEDDPNYFV